MKEFDNLTDFAVHLAEIAVVEDEFIHHGLDRAAQLIEDDAKAQFGVYQAQEGPFPAWADLAESTKADRVAQGFPENEPLLRTGELRDSISHETKGLEAVVGSTSDIMVYHELGTMHMPARPVLGPAAFRNRFEIEKLIGATAAIGIVGGRMDALVRLETGKLIAMDESMGYGYSAGSTE